MPVLPPPGFSHRQTHGDNQMFKTILVAGGVALRAFAMAPAADAHTRSGAVIASSLT
jgi:hypothetical protein